MHRRIRRRSAAVVALVALGALASACNAATAPSAPRASNQAIALTASDLTFRPAQLVLQAGVPVKLTLANEGVLEHDFTVGGLNASAGVVDGHGPGGGHAMAAMTPGTVHVSAHGGERAAVEFTPKPGTYEFYCSVAGHREAGMRGTIEVR